MTATIDSTTTLPHPSHGAGAPILETVGTAGGLRYVARSINTLYEKQRCVAVNQAGTASASPIINGAGEVAVWRPKTLGYSGGEDTQVSLEVWARVSLVEDTSAGITLTMTENGSGNTSTYSWSSDVNDAWVQFSDLDIDDDAEYLDLELEFTTFTGVDYAEVYAVAVYYKADASTAVAGSYSQNGHHPIHNEHIDGNSPLSAHLLHHMHRDIESLWQYRQGGTLVSQAFGPDGAVGGAGTSRSYPVWVPRGVDDVKVWVYIQGESVSPSGAKSLTVKASTIDGTTLDTTTTSKSSFFITQWFGYTLTVSSEALDHTGQWILISVTCGTQYLTFEAVSAYTVNGVR